MSLPSFLNQAPAQSQKPPPATVIRHVVRHTEAPHVKRIITAEPVTVKPKPEMAKPPAPVVRKPTEFIPRNEDLLTFSIFAKITLKKTQVEMLNQIFIKVLKGLMPYQSLNLKVQKVLQNDSDAYKSWQMLTQNTNKGFYNPLLKSIKTIVQWFIENNNTTNTIIEYFDFVVESHDNSVSWVHIFSTILKQQLNTIDAKKVAELIKLTKDLFGQLPQRTKHNEKENMKPLDFQTFIGIDEPKKPFDLSSKIAEIIPLAKQAKALQLEPEPQQPPQKTKTSLSSLKRITPSHVKHVTPLSENQNAFIFNETTKMFPVNPDEFGKYKPPPDPAVTIPVLDFFQVLENIEVNENKVDRIYAFSECNPYAGYCMRCAGREAFQAQWTEIEQYLDNRKVRDIVINRCRSQLPELEEEHEQTIDIASGVLETRVTDAFIMSINLSNMPSEFPFPIDNDDASAFLLHFLSTITNGKLTNAIQWFLVTVIPLIQRDNVVEFIHSQTYAGLLWHFSLLCDEVRSLLNATPLEMNTFEAVLDSIPDSLHNQKHGQGETTTTRFLTETFKGIIACKIISDSSAEECRKHFGKKVEHVTHFLPLLERMCAECNLLRTDLHMKQLTLLSQKLGVFDEGTTEGGIMSRRGVYNASVRNIRFHKLVVIRASHEKGKIIVHPY